MWSSVFKLHLKIFTAIAIALFPSFGLSAGFFNLPVYMQMPTIAFSTTPQTLYPDVCSNVYTLRTYLGNVIKRPPVYAGGLVINLSSTGPVTLYSDPACQTVAPSVAITGTGTSVNFYAMASAVGAYTITAAPAVLGIKIATQTGPIVSNPFIWIGVTSTDWSVGSNWSGGVAPSFSDVAYFDNSCTTFCSPTTNVNVNIQGLKMAASYTGTITQGGGFNFVVNSRGWYQAAGTFNGSMTGNTLTLSGGGLGEPINIVGGVLRASTGTTNAKGDIVFANGVFQHNNGTFNYYGSGIISVNYGNAVFNHYLTQGSAAPTMNSTNSVLGNLTISQVGTPRGVLGQFNVSGDVFITGSGFKGSTVINLVGAANQNIDATAAVDGALPALKINSTGGTVTLKGTISVYDTYQVISGTIDAGTSTLNIRNGDSAIGGCGYTCPYTFSAAQYNNVGLLSTQGTYAATDSLNVNGTLTLSSTNPFNTLISSTINAKGDVVVINKGMYSNASLTPILNIVGNTNQTIDCSAASGVAANRTYLPALNIQSTGGTVTFNGNCSIDGTFKHTSGTVSTGTTSITFASAAGSTFDAGTVSFYDLIIYFRAAFSLSVLSNLNVTRDLTIGGPSTSTTNMPNPGGAYSVTVGGTLTNLAGSTFNLYGATRTQGTLVNLGTINP